MAIIQTEPKLSPKEAINISYKHGTIDVIGFAKDIADEWGGKNMKIKPSIITVCSPPYIPLAICTASRKNAQERAKELHSNEL